MIGSGSVVRCLNLPSPRQQEMLVSFQKSCRRLSALQSGFLTTDDILGNFFLSGYILKFNIVEKVNPSVQCIATKCDPATVETRSERNDRKVRTAVVLAPEMPRCAPTSGSGKLEGRKLEWLNVGKGPQSHPSYGATTRRSVKSA